MHNGSDRLGEHFSNPKNVGLLAHANAVGSVGAMRWGDALKLMLEIDPDTDRIKQAKFQTFGCSSAIASSSAVTEMVTGKTTAQALDITAADIVKFLGGLPPERMYCSVMGYEALRLAIARYRGEVEPDVAMAPGTVCKCFGVGEALIARTIRTNKLTNPAEVTFHTKAGGGCVNCFKEIEAVLARVNAEMVADGELLAEQAYRPGAAAPQVFEMKPRGENPLAVSALKAVTGGPPAHLRGLPPTTPSTTPTAPAAPHDSEIARRYPDINAAVEALRPRLQRDGGDCELVNVEGNTVYLKLSGNCVGCQLASVTLSGIQAQLAEKTGRLLRVVPIDAVEAMR